MNILFDLRATQPNEAKFHGGSEYAKVLFRRLLEIKESENIVGFYVDKLQLSDNIRNLAEEYKIHLIPINSLAEIEQIVREGKYDRLYSALPYGFYALDLSSIKFLCTIHGLRAIEQPTDKFEYKYCTTLKGFTKFLFKNIFTSYYKEVKKKQIEKIFNSIDSETVVIVPSNHTKYSILSQFPYLSDDQIKIFYSPLKKLPEVSELPVGSDIFSKFGVKPNDYFLITSAGRYTKNSYRAIKALDEIFSTFDNISQKVLVLGAEKIKPLQGSIKNKNRFIFRGYVSEDELNSLYHKAFAFIYPTLNEGFGYPPLESMRYGTPVLASAIASVTEVCGNAVIYFSPFSIEEMKIRLLSIIKSENLRQFYAREGVQRFKEVSKQQEKMLDELCELILGRC